jgi:xylulokinase
VLLGIDVGTQSLKAVVVDERLQPRGRAGRALAVHHPQPGWAEQDPRDWLQALRPAIGLALAAAGITPDEVVAIGVTGQLDGAVAVDAACEPLAPALIWMDRRADAELAGIDPVLVRERAGQVADACHLAAKIRWLRAHAGLPPGARFHQPVSFLVERLCGRAVQDHALASTSMLYGLERRGWDPELLAAFAIEPQVLAPLAEAHEPAGRLDAAGAALSGLRQGTAVAVGTGDDFAAALGAGVVAPGAVLCCLGTAEIVGAIHDRPVIDRDGMVETHGFPGGRFYVENPGWLSGGALRWLRDLLGLPDFARLDALAAGASPGADGLIVLPTLAGAMAPVWRAQARGAAYGLTPAHGPGHLARAVLEGTAFAMADVVDRLDALGLATERIRLVGGGARSTLWARIRAAAARRPVELVETEDAAAMGAVACAAVVAGVAPTLAAAAGGLVRIARTVEPDPAEAEAYLAARARGRSLFDALLPLMDRPWS